MQVELGAVVVGDRTDVLALGEVEGLKRLQGFEGQALAVLDAFRIATVGILSGLNAEFSDFDLRAAFLDLNLSLGDFTSDGVHHLNLPPPRLAHPRASGALRCLVAKPQITKLPIRGRVEIQAVAKAINIAS